MNYKRAFQCKKCPQSNSEDGCPMWWEYMMTNPQTGEEKIEKQCGYSALPVFLTEVIKASNRPASAIEGMRNDVVKAVHALPSIIEDRQLLIESK